MASNPDDLRIDPAAWGGSASAVGDARGEAAERLAWSPAERAPDPVPNPDPPPSPVPVPPPIPEPPVPGPPTPQPPPGAGPAAPKAPPRGAKYRLRIAPEAKEQPEELITPEKVRSWSASLVFHIALLILLAVAVFAQPAKETKSIAVGLPAGDPAGSEFGHDLKGALGIDEPLAMPYAPLDTPADPTPTLTAAPTESLQPELAPRARVDLAEGSERGGGVMLEGTGQAGSGDGFGVAKFGLGGSELVNNVAVKVGNPQFTLIWDTEVDLDLHVLEPGGSHIYWESRRGRRGGELDVDDTDGFGPENIFWGGGLNKGNGPPGEYRWYVHFYGPANRPTRWKVRLKHNGSYKVFQGRLNAVGQKSKEYTFHIDATAGADSGEPAPATDEPPRGARAGEMADFERPADGRPRRRIGVGEAPFNAPPSMFGRDPASGAANVEIEPDDAPPAERPRNGGNRTAAAGNPTAPPAPANRGPSRDADGWVLVQPDDAGFRAAMPDVPFEEIRTLENRPGQPTLRSWTLDRGDGGFLIAFIELPESATAEGARRLEVEARALMAETRGSNLATTPLDLGGPPALSVAFDVPDRIVAGGGGVKARLALVGRRLYRASAMGTRDFLARPETTRFLESFRPDAAPAR
jgi:hypothetical protein